jgi:hypothetical protein
VPNVTAELAAMEFAAKEYAAKEYAAMTRMDAAETRQ